MRNSRASGPTSRDHEPLYGKSWSVLSPSGAEPRWNSAFVLFHSTDQPVSAAPCASSTSPQVTRSDVGESRSAKTRAHSVRPGGAAAAMAPRWSW